MTRHDYQGLSHRSWHRVVTLTPSPVGQVTIVGKAQTPAQARPFEKVYGTQPDNKQPNVLWASTLVTKVEGTTDVWAVVVNPKGPAECFFVPHNEPDLIAGCQ
jgi:hypothetical protein